MKCSVTQKTGDLVETARGYLPRPPFISAAMDAGPPSAALNVSQVSTIFKKVNSRH